MMDTLRHRLGVILLGWAKRLMSPEAVGCNAAAYKFTCGTCNKTVTQILEPEAILRLTNQGTWRKEPCCEHYLIDAKKESGI